MRLRSSAPTRLDLAGGTLDIWPLYLFHDGAVTLNVATSLRASCAISPSEDDAWHLVSHDTGAATVLTDLDATAPPSHRLVGRLLHYFRPPPVRIETRSDSPVGAGLAGSSALTIALCAALARLTGVDEAPEPLMTLAMNLEAQVLGIPTGAQDYRPATYGGASAVELGPGGVVRRPLAVDLDALHRRLVVVYTGQSRDSGLNNWEVTRRHLDGDQTVRTLFDEITAVAVAMRAALEAARWPDVADLVDREWRLRQQLAPGVSTPVIDDLITRGRDAGARAAKICGAGGGGCLLLLADPDAVSSVRTTLAAAGARVLDVALEPQGVTVEAAS